MKMSTDLAEMLIKVRKSSGDDPSVIVVLCASSYCKGLSTSSLAIGKDGPIITCQHTIKWCKVNNIQRPFVLCVSL